MSEISQVLSQSARRLHQATTTGSEPASAAELGRQLRGPAEGFLAQRRAITVLSLIGIGAMGLISLYQMGVIRHLPEPPLPKLDADRVDGSAEAYQRFATPDGVMGLGNFAVTMGLAGMGGPDRARRQPWIPLAMAGKVAFDALQMLRMAREQWKKYGAFCFWCLLSAAATAGTAALTIPEARAALRHITRRQKAA